MEGKPKFISFLMYIVLSVVLLGLINMIFDLHRFAFAFEFLVLLVLMFIGLIATMGISSNSRWAWILMTILFLFIFVDMLLIYVLSKPTPEFFFLLVAATIAGFFVSLFSVERTREEIPDHVEKTFSPGKYIASKTGTKFHAPKCDWAKRIKKKNAVWFDSKQEAKKAGYKADSCVK